MMDAQGKPRLSRAMIQRLGGCIAEDTTAVTAHAHVSFNDRRRHERNLDRQHVANYRTSRLASRTHVRQIGMELGVPRKPREKHEIHTVRTHRRPTDAERVDFGVNRPSAGFVEPPGRRFNPYG